MLCVHRAGLIFHMSRDFVFPATHTYTLPCKRTHLQAGLFCVHVVCTVGICAVVAVFSLFFLLHFIEISNTLIVFISIFFLCRHLLTSTSPSPSLFSTIFTWNYAFFFRNIYKKNRSNSNICVCL